VAHQFNSLFFLSLFGTLTALFAVEVQAEGSFSLEGLSFDCPTCSRADKPGLCQKDLKLVDCSTLRDRLLVTRLKAVASKDAFKEDHRELPKLKELTAFITAPSQSEALPNSKIIASLLILYGERGAQHFFEVPISVDDKSSLLITAIEKGLLKEKVLGYLREFIFEFSPTISHELAVKFAQTEKDFPANPFLLSRLTASDAARAQTTLQVYEKTCSKAACSDFFKDLRERLAKCATNLSDTGCSAKSFEDLPLAAQNFLGRSQAHMLKAGLGPKGKALEGLAEPARSKKTLMLLSRLNYQDHRSVELIELHNRALRKLLSLRSPAVLEDLLDAELLDADIVDMMTAFGTNDTIASGLVSQLFTDRAEYLMLLDRKEEARFYLEKSFEVSGRRIESRDKLVKQELLYSGADARAGLLEVLKKNPKDARSVSLSNFLLPLIFIGSIITAGFLAKNLFFKKKPPPRKRRMRASEYKLKLDQARRAVLLEKFGLSRKAEMGELEAAYRKMAKQHHPDSSGGSNDKFVEINNHYRELKKIM